MSPPPSLSVFWRLRCRVGANRLALLRSDSWVRSVSILFSSLLVSGFGFATSIAGFSFLANQKLPLGGDIVGLLLDLFFLSTGTLLCLSTGLILFGSLFDSQESAFLLSKPVADDRVFAHQFIGALLFSSAALVLLALPLLLAYGLAMDAGPLYFLLLPAYFLATPLLPGSLGAILCLGLVRWIPRRRKEALAALGVLLVLGALVWIGIGLRNLRFAKPGDDEVLNEVLGHVRFASAAWLPTHWQSQGLRQAARGQWEPALRYLSLSLTTGLMAFCLSAWVARRWYRIGLDRLSQQERRQHTGRFAWLDHLPTIMPGLTRQEKSLLVKDFRTFRRDVRQWGQGLLFLVILSFYFSSLRRMFPGDIPQAFRNGLSLLNIGVVGMLLCASCGRFVFPLVSLEGRRVWLLGLTPISRLLWVRGKFFFSLLLCLLFALPLVALSDTMLEMPLPAMLVHQVTAIYLSCGLSGLASGLGAVWPSFQEKDPSRIAVGYGGTLSLVISLAFLLGCMSLTALPWHLARAAGGEEFPRWGWLLVFPGMLAGTALTGLATLFPLHAGRVRLDAMEF